MTTEDQIEHCLDSVSQVFELVGTSTDDIDSLNVAFGKGNLKGMKQVIEKYFL